MNNMILFKMNLADLSTCVFCHREGTVVHAFLRCENVARFWRSMEGLMRRVIDRHFRLSDVDKISDTLPMTITTDTVILATQERIYRNRYTGTAGTLALAQVRSKLYTKMIKEHFLAKFSLNQQNFHKTWDSIEDDLSSYRYPTD